MNTDIFLIVSFYVLLINICAFVVMFVDKKAAIKQKRRISEKTLFTLALIGGTVGSLWGMQCFRHKTKHKSFTIGMPLILIAQLGLLAWYFYEFFV